MNFADSYVGRLRALVGRHRLLVPGARVLIEREDGFILMQHRTDFNIWGLPGGNAEVGEGLHDCAIRETFEETGVTVRNLRPFGFSCDPEFETITFPNGDESQFFVLMFCSREYDGDAHVNDSESHSVAWRSPDDLPDMLPNMRRSVHAFLDFKRSGEFQMI
nr:NUDIX domain-containing protein [Rhizobium sp. TCK]